MRPLTRLLVLGCAAVLLGLVVSAPAQEKTGKLRFGVGPLQPTPGETKKAYVHLATAYADRLIALREGELVEDPPISRFDSRTLEQIYEREGEHRRGVTG